MRQNDQNTRKMRIMALACLFEFEVEPFRLDSQRVLSLLSSM